jgi:hypothetical protein
VHRDILSIGLLRSLWFNQGRISLNNLWFIWQVIFCAAGFYIYHGFILHLLKHRNRESLLKGKDQYNLPPCTYQFSLATLYTKVIFYYFYKTRYLNKEVNHFVPYPSVRVHWQICKSLRLEKFRTDKREKENACFLPSGQASETLQDVVAISLSCCHLYKTLFNWRHGKAS